MQDIVKIFKSVSISSLAFLTCMVFIFGMEGLPRSVLLLDAILLFLLLTGVRILVRIQHDNRKITQNSLRRKNILIVGAGTTGVLILNEIRKDTKTDLNPVGFVDDNPYKKGSNIQGVPVLGTCSEIPDIASKLDINEAIICMPSAAWKYLHIIFYI